MSAGAVPAGTTAPLLSVIAPPLSDVNSVAQLRPSQNSHACVTTAVVKAWPVAGLIEGRVTFMSSVTVAPAEEKASDCAR